MEQKSFKQVISIAYNNMAMSWPQGIGFALKIFACFSWIFLFPAL
jgi:hypothetical protein